MIRVLVVASSPVSQLALERTIRAVPKFAIVDQAEVGATARTTKHTDPDVVIAEWEGRNLEDAPAISHWAASGVPVILMADDPTLDATAEALRSGARAVLPKNSSAPELIATVEAVAAGLIVLHPDDVEDLVSRPAQTATERAAVLPEALTQREVQVLNLIAEGLGNKEIASHLKISEHTAKFHVASIMGKLGATSRTEAVTLGIRQGLIMV